MKKLQILSDDFLAQLSEKDISPLSRAAMAKLSGGYDRATVHFDCADVCKMDESTGELYDCVDL